ncbi:MAG: diguanylate cyclase [Clostridia bacterium]|nr:diguanylate cyclase [Clostridia bacterium]
MKTLHLTYYFQTNLFCIVLILLMYANISQAKPSRSDQRIFRALLKLSVLFGISDMTTWAINGTDMRFANIFVHLANMIFFITSTAISYGWFMYVMYQVNPNRERVKKINIFASLPMMIFIVQVIISPWTKILYYIDKDNVYHRGFGIYSHWIVSWGYMVAVTSIILYNIRKAESRMKKRELAPMLLFLFFPMIGSLAQVFFYGTSVILCGLTISILIIFIRHQNSQISIDALTETNNRRQLNRYLDDRITNSKSDDSILLIMMDIDGFKKINDVYGHLEGDKALVTIAQLLKQVCGKVNGKLFLARFGGDEFVYVATGKNIPSADAVISEIKAGLEHINSNSKTDYKLGISAGYVSDKISAFNSLDDILSQADKNMYTEKKKK